MRLYLCRHAEAVDNTGEPSIDDDCWLTVRGRDQARRVGKALRKEGVAFDAILMSPLVRAVQTADGLIEGLHFEGAPEVLRSLAPGGTLGDLLAQLPLRIAEHEHVALVGHEPMMSQWAAGLLGTRTFDRPFKKGAVLGLKWEGLPEPGTGAGLFFLTPKGLSLEPL